MHSQCESRVCLPNNSCGTSVDVAYIDPAGNGTACMRSSPCSSIEAALATRPAYLKFAGTSSSNDGIKFTDQNLVILAESRAELTRATAGPVITVDGSSQISIFDLEIIGATGPEGTGISMPVGNTANVSLQRVVIRDNAATGLQVGGGNTATVSHSTITGNAGAGVSAQASTITITQSTIRGNTGLGVQSDSSMVNVTQSTIGSNIGGGVKINTPTELNMANNFIVGNGSETAAVGGIDIQVGSATIQALQFNTIVDNRKRTEQSSAAGIVCYGRIVVPNNLIFRNTGGDASNAQTAGDCSYGNSLLTTPSLPGFVSATDYHLTPATPVGTIRDSFSCSGQIDIDGDARPQGGSCDLGADEY